MACNRPELESKRLYAGDSGNTRNGFSDYKQVDRANNTFGTQVKGADESAAAYFEGECSLHDSRIIHGATPNTRPYCRCGYTMRYFSMEAKVIPEKNPGFKIWLARGKDIAGNPFVTVSSEPKR